MGGRLPDDGSGQYVARVLSGETAVMKAVAMMAAMKAAVMMAVAIVTIAIILNYSRPGLAGRGSRGRLSTVTHNVTAITTYITTSLLSSTVATISPSLVNVARAHTYMYKCKIPIATCRATYAPFISTIIIITSCRFGQKGVCSCPCYREPQYTVYKPY